MDTQKKTTVHNIILWIMVAVILFLTGYILYLNKKSQTTIQTIETLQQQDEGKYTQFYYEREFQALKKENRELYDSLKNQKDYITSLEKFSYRVKYVTDTVYTEAEIREEVKDLPNETYVYHNETDSLTYQLQVNSKIEPNWYSLNVDVKDDFTIVNKTYADGRMTTSIESANKGEISDITAWQKSTRKKWYQRFAFGPSVIVGYDPINRNFGTMVGVSVTYNILGK